MRLTLRTLLAYLDDTLEPAQAKAIGQKIAESPTAQELIERIKDVVRRRRLLPPPVNGADAKLDSNTIAEYIDSVLPAEQLGQVEETCLESDVYLAEIAACHQILTIILSEPALVPPTAKQRMYALVRGPEAIPARAVVQTAPGSETGAATEHDEADDALLLGLPLYRGQGPWYRRLAPAAAVLLFAVLLGVAIWKAIPSNQSARGPAAPAGNPPTTKAETEAPKTTKPEADKGSAPKTDASQTSAANNESKTTPPKTDNPTKPPVPETRVSEKPQPPPEPVTPPAGAKPVHKVVGKYLSPAEAEPDVLLARAEEKDPWKWLGHNAPVATEDSLLTLAGYRSQVRLNNGLELILWGDLPSRYPALLLDSAVILHDALDVDLDLTLRHGRVAITNPKPDPKRARVHFQDQAWELTLENAATVALELSGKTQPGYSQETKSLGPAIFVALFVLKGHAQLKVGSGIYSLQEPKGPALFLWDTFKGPTGPFALDRLPPWADKAGEKQPAATVRALSSLSRQLKGPKNVDTTLAEMVTEETNLPLAIYGLVAIQNLPALLDVLADEHHATGRQVAINTLRYWLSQHADHDQQLYAALKAKYKSAEPAEIILALLHGYTPEERAKHETFEQLIEYLLSDKLPIRELAAWQLRALPETEELAKKIPYDPAGGIDQRNAAHDLWKKEVPTGQMPRKGPPPANGTPRSRK